MDPERIKVFLVRALHDAGPTLMAQEISAELNFDYRGEDELRGVVMLLYCERVEHPCYAVVLKPANIRWSDSKEE